MSQLCVAGEKIVTICQKGDKLIEEEVSKVYRTTKLKGMCCPGGPRSIDSGSGLELD